MSESRMNPLLSSKCVVVSATASGSSGYGHASSWKMIALALAPVGSYLDSAQSVGPNASVTAMDGGAFVPGHVTDCHVSNAFAAISPASDRPTCRAAALASA